MVGAQKNSLFLAESKILRGREGINLLAHACRSNSLSFSFLLFQCSPFLSFFFLRLFLNTCFLFLGFQIPNTIMLSFPSVHDKGPLIVPVVTRFYYFGPQQPLFGLGVLADHHWYVCVPLPIARQKKTILFVCLPWHPFLLWCGCLLYPYPSWHALSGSNSVLLLLGVMSSQQDTSPKRA